MPSSNGINSNTQNAIESECATYNLNEREREREKHLK